MSGTPRVPLPLDAPLTPSPEQADTLFRRELLRPEYHDQNPVQQLLRWLGRQLESGLDRASSVGPVGTVGALLVLLVLLVLVGTLVSRTRTTARAGRAQGPVLDQEQLSAAALRARALTALENGDAVGAVIEAFRALTVRQVELGLLGDQAGATAHEVADALGNRFPQRRTQLEQAAGLFDQVRYGDRPATPEQARTVLALDDDLVGVR